MIFNPFWITLTELLVVPGTSCTSPVSAPGIYIYEVYGSYKLTWWVNRAPNVAVWLNSAQYQW